MIADKDRLPPPPLFQCNTYDNDSYLSENATPEPRCVRLETTDLQGSTDTSGGVACQMVTDQCQRVADGAACDAWKKRLRETEAMEMIVAQMPAELKRARADYVIDNDGTLTSLDEAVTEVWSALQQQAAELTETVRV